MSVARSVNRSSVFRRPPVGDDDGDAEAEQEGQHDEDVERCQGLRCGCVVLGGRLKPKVRSDGYDLA